jgi:hypothetical protein
VPSGRRNGANRGLKSNLTGPAHGGKKEYTTSYAKAKGYERKIILDAGERARSRAFEKIIGEACANAFLGIADCSDFSVDIESIRWKRDAGELRIIVGLLVYSAGWRRRQRWTTTVPNQRRTDNRTPWSDTLTSRGL